MKTLYSTLILGLFFGSLTAQIIANVCEGEDVYLYIAPPVTADSIQWQFSATGSGYLDMPGEISDTLSLAAIQTGGYFRARIDNMVCSAFYSDTHHVIVSQPPSPAIAGPDQNVNGSTTTLSATPPAIGMGTWYVISGTGGILGNPGSAQGSFTGISNTSYTLVWTISNPPCPVSSDTVIVVFSGASLPSIQCNGQTIYIHPTDNHGSIQWGCIGVVAGAGDDYDGASNTALIVQNCLPPNAAYVCDTLTAYGFSDWYLPSYNELDCMRTNAAIIGGFTNGGYWSSTEGTGIWTANARYRTFPSGVSGYGSKSSLKSVRCIRK
jgi:hypothetical protein